MLIHDRVCCDVCRQYIGQVYGRVYTARAVPDMNAPPHFAVCPDCSVVIDRSAQPVVLEARQ